MTTTQGSRIGELQRFEGHRSWVQSVAFSPDGRYGLSGSGQPPAADKPVSDYTVRLWDLKACTEQLCLTGHTDRVTSVVFSPDGRRILTGSYDGTVRLWDLETGKEVRRLRGHTDRVRSVAMAPDGRYALSGGCDMTVRLWDVETGKQVHQFRKHKHWVLSVAFDANGSHALSGSLDGTVRLWTVASGREIYPGSFFGALWHRLTRREVHAFDQHGRTATGVVFTPDGRALSGSMDKSIRLWDVRTGKELREFHGHEAGVTSVAISADGNRILSGSLDKTARLWDAHCGKELYCCRGHLGEVMTVALARDGRRALTGGADWTIRLWGLPGAEVGS
jgi:WD40 repeat protein